MIEIFSLPLKELVELVLERFDSARRERREIRRFLDATIDRTSTIGAEWLPDASFILNMESAYVPVRLIGGDGREEELRTVLARDGRLVIQGGAGAGKSTLTRYISCLMAKAITQAKQCGDLPHERLNCPTLFPIRVELASCNSGIGVERALLSSVPRVSDRYIAKKLDAGGVLILFDGLDEIADDDRRAVILREIGELSHTLEEKNNRLLVTTRPTGYVHTILQKSHYKLYRIQELNADQQEEVVTRYYEHWSKSGRDIDSNWQTKANGLIEQLRTNPGLGRLKDNPMLLAQTAFLYYRGETLPARRHELYDRLLRHLLTKREQYVKPDEVNERLALAGTLALAMHMQRTLDGLSRSDLVKILKEDAIRRKQQQAGVAEDFHRQLERMEREWGILARRGGHAGAQERLAMVNLSIQEYLAAYALHVIPKRFSSVVQPHLHETWWEEVLLLYAAMPDPITHQSRLDQVIKELIDTNTQPNQDAWIKAGRCLAGESGHGIRSRYHDRIVQKLKDQSYGDQDINVRSFQALCQIEPDGLSFVLDRILGRIAAYDRHSVLTLLQRMFDANARQQLRSILLSVLNKQEAGIPIHERISLAEALGQIGDTRLGAFVALETRRYEKDGNIKIAKYPVTNVEYARFVETMGHSAPSHWVGGSYPVRQANHPVTHVSLEDVATYCAWLGSHKGCEIRLPYQSEWLAAGSTAGVHCRFPWGHDFLDQSYLNFRRNQQGTTPVGIYPEGQSASGVADLLGNVWEWTAERVGEKYVLKGGAWDTMDELAKEGLDLKLLKAPHAREANIGFRLVEIASR